MPITLLFLVKLIIYICHMVITPLRISTRLKLKRMRKVRLTSITYIHKIWTLWRIRAWALQAESSPPGFILAVLGLQKTLLVDQRLSNCPSNFFSKLRSSKSKEAPPLSTSAFIPSMKSLKSISRLSWPLKRRLTCRKSSHSAPFNLIVRGMRVPHQSSLMNTPAVSREGLRTSF